MADAAAVVTRLFELLAAGPAEDAAAVLADDVELRNTGFPTVRGERVRDIIRAVERRRITFAVDMHHLVEDGEVVLTERTDHIGYGRYRASFWVCGTFVVRDGRIVLWHDHFALGSVLRGAATGLAGLLRRPA